MGTRAQSRGKATAANVVDRNVTPIRPRYRKQSRFRADRCQRLAKPWDRVGWSAMGAKYGRLGQNAWILERAMRTGFARPCQAL
jgi:hypothetical protein